MEILIPHPSFSTKIKASPAPFISESGTAFFSISVFYIHHGRIPIVQSYTPSESMSFRFDQFHVCLWAVADKIFIQTISMYRDRGVEFLVSVVMHRSAVPPVAGSYIDEVLVFDSDVRGGGTRRCHPILNGAIERLERIKDDTVTSGQCAICLEEFCRRKDLVLGRTSCSHTFHYRCVKKWLEWRQTCPLCRSDICRLIVS